MSFTTGLRERARRRARTIVFPEGLEPRVHQAVAEIQGEELLQPVLLGPEDQVRHGLSDAGALHPELVRVLDPKRTEGRDRYAHQYLEVTKDREVLTVDEAFEISQHPLVRGALMVSLGDVEGLVAGTAHATSDVVRAAIRCVGPAPGFRTVSSSFYMVVPPFRADHEEVLTFCDAGVVPDPDPGQLAEIAMAACDARVHVVGDAPKVAFLSYSTRGSASGPSVEKVTSALEIFRRRMPNVEADGELQADAALIEAVARGKAPDSPVGGKANVLIFPNLDSGNIAYKLVHRLARATALGPILQGLSRPCNDLSRGATSEDIVEVACITSVMASEGGLPVAEPPP